MAAENIPKRIRNIKIMNNHKYKGKQSRFLDNNHFLGKKFRKNKVFAIKPSQK